MTKRKTRKAFAVYCLFVSESLRSNSANHLHNSNLADTEMARMQIIRVSENGFPDEPLAASGPPLNRKAHTPAITPLEARARRTRKLKFHFGRVLGFAGDSFTLVANTHNSFNVRRRVRSHIAIVRFHSFFCCAFFVVAFVLRCCDDPRV